MTADVLLPDINDEMNQSSNETAINIEDIENLDDIRARFESTFNQAVATEKADLVDNILRREFGHLKLATNPQFRQRVLDAFLEDEALVDTVTDSIEDDVALEITSNFN